MPTFRRDCRINRLFSSATSAINVFLNPPSPPSSPDELPISPHCNQRRHDVEAVEEADEAQGGGEQRQRAKIPSDCFLQVPQHFDSAGLSLAIGPPPSPLMRRVSTASTDDTTLADCGRIFSPPPRRCSNSSAYSENSTTSTSFVAPSVSSRSNSFASYYSEPTETPLDERPATLAVGYRLRPHSAQVFGRRGDRHAPVGHRYALLLTRFSVKTTKTKVSKARAS